MRNYSSVHNGLKVFATKCFILNLKCYTSFAYISIEYGAII